MAGNGLADPVGFFCYLFAVRHNNSPFSIDDKGNRSVFPGFYFGLGRQTKISGIQFFPHLPTQGQGLWKAGAGV